MSLLFYPSNAIDVETVQDSVEQKLFILKSCSGMKFSNCTRSENALWNLMSVVSLLMSYRKVVTYQSWSDKTLFSFWNVELNVHTWSCITYI